MRAGVPGRTENVHIRSLVGRYLEHSRIYCFGSGEKMRIYIASGDFLTRHRAPRRSRRAGGRPDASPKSCAAFWTYSCGIPSTRGKCSARSTYTKVKPAPGQPPVDSQMAMFGYFQNGFEQATETLLPP